MSDAGSLARRTRDRHELLAERAELRYAYCTKDGC
jgi:hypothetical protein